MWLQISEDTTFNLGIARAVKIGSGASGENFALVAELTGGEEVILAEFHMPQAAQDALERVNRALSDGTRVFTLGD